VLSNPAPMLTVIRNAAKRAEEALSPLSSDESNLATQLIKGYSVVEVPGKWNRNIDLALENVVLPKPRLLIDFVTVPCKQEVGLMKQTRHVRQASSLVKKMNLARQTLMRATAGQSVLTRFSALFTSYDRSGCNYGLPIICFHERDF